MEMDFWVRHRLKGLDVLILRMSSFGCSAGISVLHIVWDKVARYGLCWAKILLVQSVANLAIIPWWKRIVNVLVIVEIFMTLEAKHISWSFERLRDWGSLASSHILILEHHRFINCCGLFQTRCWLQKTRYNVNKAVSIKALTGSIFWVWCNFDYHLQGAYFPSSASAAGDIVGMIEQEIGPNALIWKRNHHYQIRANFTNLLIEQKLAIRAHHIPTQARGSPAAGEKAWPEII